MIQKNNVLSIIVRTFDYIYGVKEVNEHYTSVFSYDYYNLFYEDWNRLVENLYTILKLTYNDLPPQFIIRSVDSNTELLIDTTSFSYKATFLNI